MTVRTRSRLPAAALAAVVAAGTLLAGAGAASAAPAPATGTVTLVHGLRGVVADIYVDGRKVLSAFEPQRMTDPIRLPPGLHDMQVRATGTAATSKPAVEAQVTVKAGDRLSVAVGLTPTGSATAEVFNDKVPALTDGHSAVVVRAVAATSGVRVRLGAAALPGTLTTGGQLLAPKAPGTYPISLVPTAGTEPVLAPQDVPVNAGNATVLYLIGSSKAGTLAWLAETLPTSAAAAPRTVQTGNSGLAAENSGPPVLAVGLIALALAAAVGLVFTVRIRKVSALRRARAGGPTGRPGGGRHLAAAGTTSAGAARTSRDRPAAAATSGSRDGRATAGGGTASRSKAGAGRHLAATARRADQPAR